MYLSAPSTSFHNENNPSFKSPFTVNFSIGIKDRCCPLRFLSTVLNPTNDKSNPVTSWFIAPNILKLNLEIDSSLEALKDSSRNTDNWALLSPT